MLSSKLYNLTRLINGLVATFKVSLPIQLQRSWQTLAFSDWSELLHLGFSTPWMSDRPPCLGGLEWHLEVRNSKERGCTSTQHLHAEGAQSQYLVAATLCNQGLIHLYRLKSKALPTGFHPKYLEHTGQRVDNLCSTKIRHSFHHHHQGGGDANTFGQSKGSVWKCQF